MRVNIKDMDFQEYFEPEINELESQSKKNEELYDEVHQSLEKNLERLNAKTMYGAGTPHKDISALGDTLNSIRSNQVQIIKEKSNVKKTIIDLELKRSNQKIEAQASNTNETLMRELLMEFNHKVPNFNEVSPSEKSNTKGAEELANLDPKQLGINENDLKMIDKFAETGGKR